MSRTKCEWIRELIPDYAAGRLNDDEIALAGLHFADCNECRDELDLVQLVFSSRAMEPEGLGDKINAAVRYILRERVPARPVTIIIPGI